MIIRCESEHSSESPGGEFRRWNWRLELPVATTQQLTRRWGVWAFLPLPSSRSNNLQKVIFPILQLAANNGGRQGPKEGELSTFWPVISGAGDAQLRRGKSRSISGPGGMPVVLWTPTTTCSRAQCASERFASFFLKTFPLLRGLNFTGAKTVMWWTIKSSPQLLNSAEQHNIPGEGRWMKDLPGRGVRKSPVTSETQIPSLLRTWERLSVILVLSGALSPAGEGSSLLALGVFLCCKGFFRSLLSPRAKSWGRFLSLEVRRAAGEGGLLQGTVNRLCKASARWKRGICCAGGRAACSHCPWSGRSGADGWSLGSPRAERRFRWHQPLEWLVTPGLHVQHEKFCIKRKKCASNHTKCSIFAFWGRWRVQCCSSSPKLNGFLKNFWFGCHMAKINQSFTPL